jgi:hypothetical protein
MIQVQNLKRISHAIVLAYVCIGLAALVAVMLIPDMVIGEGRFDAFVHQVEKVDFKWWITGFALGLWLLPILLLITYLNAKRVGQLLHDFQGVLRSILANRTLPIIVDIDQKIPIRLDEPLAVPIELHTEVDIDCDVELEAEVPIRTELPIETKVQTNVLGIGTISIPIRARLPVDLVIPFKGCTRVKATGVPIAVSEIGIARLPAIELPLRARIQARIDLLSNFNSAESFLNRADTGLLDTVKRIMARLWHALFK